jgi:aminopeptidase N
VPEGYIVISNGEGKQSENNGNTMWTWIEREAVSTYLTSVVIGNFSHAEKESSSIPLHYYWPKDIEDLGYDAMLTFGDLTR